MALVDEWNASRQNARDAVAAEKFGWTGGQRQLSIERDLADDGKQENMTIGGWTIWQREVEPDHDREIDG